MHPPTWPAPCRPDFYLRRRSMVLVAMRVVRTTLCECAEMAAGAGASMPTMAPGVSLGASAQVMQHVCTSSSLPAKLGGLQPHCIPCHPCCTVMYDMDKRQTLWLGAANSPPATFFKAYVHLGHKVSGLDKEQRGRDDAEQAYTATEGRSPKAVPSPPACPACLYPATVQSTTPAAPA